MIYLLDLAKLKDLLPLMWLKPKKGTIVVNTPLINFSFRKLKYMDIYTNRLTCFHTIVPMCHDPNLGFVTKAKGLQGCGQD